MDNLCTVLERTAAALEGKGGADAAVAQKLQAALRKVQACM